MIAGRTNARELQLRPEDLAVRSPLLQRYSELSNQLSLYLSRNRSLNKIGYMLMRWSI